MARRYELYELIAEKLKLEPELFDIAVYNLAALIKDCPDNDIVQDWVKIFNTKFKNEIILILLDKSDESDRLRSNTPFGSILTEKERYTIFNKYSMVKYT